MKKTTITKTDLYTKIVLTIIAACLVVMLSRDVSIIPAAQAQNAMEPQTKRAPVRVDIVAVNGEAFSGMDVGLPPRLPVTGN